MRIFLRTGDGVVMLEDLREQGMLLLPLITLRFRAVIQMEHVVEVVDVERQVRREKCKGGRRGRSGKRDDRIVVVPKGDILVVILVHDTDIDKVSCDAFVTDKGSQR